MEKKILEKSEALFIAALQSDVQELKDELETQKLKEGIIASILSVRDGEMLLKIAKAMRNENAPGTKAKNKDDVIVDQGNM